MSKDLSLQNIRKSFFLKNFFLFLIPALLSIVIIGVSSVLFTYHDVKRHVEESNIGILDNATNTVEGIIKEFEDLNINLSSNSSIKFRLKRILSTSPLVLSADDHTAFRTILDMIFVSANTNKYIHSIYIYFDSPNNLFISSIDKQIHAVPDSADRSWHDRYMLYKDRPVSAWADLRSMELNYAEKDDRRLLTLYKKTYSTISERNPDGVLVLNIYIDSLNRLLDSITTSPEQILMVADDQNNRIFGSRLSANLSDDIASIDAHTTYVNTHSGKYVVIQKKFPGYNWKFISLVPYNTLYEIPNRILISTLLGFMLAMLASVAFALYNTKKAYLHFGSLLTIIESTQKGESVADIQPPSSNKEYSYIIHNLLKTFIEHDYLTVQKKLEMQTLELQVMQAQIDPHFLLNTMETVYWKTMELSRSPNEASAMIEDISSILKYSLYNPMEMVCLLEEIDIAKSYLNIQRVRHQHSFMEEWDFDPMLIEYKINKLILQPILENAIYHGYRDGGHRTKIRVKIHRQDTHLRITVSDNGKGIPRDRLVEIRQSLQKDNTDFSQHIGLYNTHKRIVLMHGEPYGLRISSLYRVGTCIRIDVPMLR